MPTMAADIPLEILGKVFELVVPEMLDNTTHKSLLALCLVCKPWRNAAYLHHPLWSKISIDHTSNEDFASDKILRWLSRSGGHPRALEYVTPCMARNPYCEDTGPCVAPSPMLAKVLRHAHRIDHLSISCMGVQCILSLGALVNDMSDKSPVSPSQRFEELPIASMTLLLRQEPDTTAPLPLPRISSLQLDIPDDPFRFFRTGWIVPAPRRNISSTTLQNITSLSLNSGWSLADLAETLVACTNLLDLTLGLLNHSYFPTTNSIKRDGIALPKVTSLVLTDLQAQSLPILDVLRLRVGTLRKIYVSFGSPGQARPLGAPEMLFGSDVASVIRSSWIPFIRKHAEALETLSIRDGALSNDPVLEGLFSADVDRPNIQRLTLDGIVPSPSFFSGESAPFLLNSPHLESLSFLDMDASFAVHELLGFLERRRPYHVVEGKPVFEGPPDTIKRVTVAYRGPSSYASRYDTVTEWTVEPHSEEMLAVVSALTKEGMDVEIGPFHRLTPKR